MWALTVGIKTPKRSARDGEARARTSVRYHTDIPVFPSASPCKRISLFGENQLRVQRRSLAPALSGHSHEKDPQKERDLVAVLQAVIREDQEEIRVRMAFLAKKYADAISDSKAAD